MQARQLGRAFVVCAMFTAACAKPSEKSSAAKVETQPVASTTASLSQPSLAPSVSAAPVASAPAPHVTFAPEGALPQTEVKPTADNDPSFNERARRLFDAVLTEEPEEGMPFFFPKEAYMQVKDIPAADVDWKARLVAAYRRDIKALTKSVRAQGGTPEFVELVVPDQGKWVKPHEELNKVGYFRVFGSKLRYRTEPNGKVKEIPVKSLISWRGKWYVVHLSSIK